MRFLHAQPIFSGKKGTMTRPVRKPYTHLPPPYRLRHFLSQRTALLTEFSCGKLAQFRQRTQKFALFSAFSPSHLFQQKLFQCLKNLFSGLQKFFCGKTNMGNTHTTHGASRAWCGEPAHVVGAYILDIQEKEHGLYKTADCGAEQCRRKLRSRMPDTG